MPNSPSLPHLAALRAKATPGEWLWDEPDNWLGLSARVCTTKYEPIAQVQLSGWPKRIGRANAAFIAAAGSFDFAALARRVEALERVADAARDHTGYGVSPNSKLGKALAALTPQQTQEQQP
jgi:hypothetical protein